MKSRTGQPRNNTGEVIRGARSLSLSAQHLSFYPSSALKAQYSPVSNPSRHLGYPMDFGQGLAIHQNLLRVEPNPHDSLVHPSPTLSNRCTLLSWTRRSPGGKSVPRSFRPCSMDMTTRLTKIENHCSTGLDHRVDRHVPLIKHRDRIKVAGRKVERMLDRR